MRLNDVVRQRDQELSLGDCLAVRVRRLQQPRVVSAAARTSRAIAYAQQ
jgi:hypothetical protein